MATIDINDIATIGVVKDQPGFMLPPEAWTRAQNVRVVDRDIEMLKGWEQIFGTPAVQPHFLLPISTQSTHFWLYVSLTAAHVYDGTNHTDITRAAGATPYTASAGRDWNGTILGGIAILNNGADVPQFWATPAVGTDLADLTNWPATHRAKVVRAFNNFLIAYNLTVSGTSRPHRVLWSHPADPGSVPSSWDVTNATVDAGETDLPDVQSGVIVDALPLGATMFIYKEGAIWRQSYIGGRFIFDFKPFMTTVGALAPRCVCETPDGLRHVVATQDDIIWHNGSAQESILTKRMRRAVFSDIDTENYLNSFIFANPPYNEVWFCYPSQGQEFPNKAVIWNAERGGGAITEAVDITFRCAAIGPIESASEGTWEDGSNTWEEEEGAWSEISRRRVVIGSPADTKLYGLDRGTTRDGVTIVSDLTREDLALLGRKRNGEWIVDFETLKMVSKLMPKMTEGYIDVWVGSRMLVDGPITWSGPHRFDPSTDVYVTMPPISGRSLSVSFTNDDDVAWKLSGFKYDIVKLGKY